MLTTKELKLKGIKIPKGWRAIKTGEIMGGNWRYIDIVNIKYGDNNFITPSINCLIDGIDKRMAAGWKNTSLYIKPK